MRVELEGLEQAIGYPFHNKALLARALTHRSLVHEKDATGAAGLLDNEQLEFLGDSILGFLVSEALVSHYSGLPEGRLSKFKAHLVSASHLYSVAQTLELGKYLLLGRGEELSGGRAKRALLADALEALIAAVYLDAGIEPAREVVSRFVIGDPDRLPFPGGTDYKSALQEFAQARKLPPPRYTIVGQRGPEHAKTFTVEVRLGREWRSEAEDLSKKSAGQKAAQLLLARITESGDPAPAGDLLQDLEDGG